MFRSLNARFIAAFTAISLCSLVLVGFFAMRLIQDQAKTQTLREMHVAAEEIAWIEANTRGNRLIERVRILYERRNMVAERVGASIWILDPTGTQAYLRDPPGVQQALHMTEDKLQQMLTQFNSEGWFEDTSIYEENKTYYTVGYKLQDDAGIVLVHCPAELVSLVTRDLLTRLFFALLIVVALAAVVLFFTTRRISRPLKRIGAAAEAYTSGKFDTRVTLKGKDEVAQLATTFNHMADELDNLEEMRRGFVANVSHELKSPLTSVQGYVQAMLDGTIDADDRPKYLGVVLAETQRLTKLIGELLDLSRLESGKFPLEKTRFDVNELIRRVLVNFLGRIEERGLSIDVQFGEETCFVYADAARIEQVLINLIDNAVKFAATEITLWTHGADDKAWIAVSDDGRGISSEDSPFIFDRFYKADKAHSGQGTGLGLSIVQKILDQHGQTIRLQSAPGEGAKFVFSLGKEPAGEK